MRVIPAGTYHVVVRRRVTDYRTNNIVSDQTLTVPSGGVARNEIALWSRRWEVQLLNESSEELRNCVVTIDGAIYPPWTGEDVVFTDNAGKVIITPIPIGGFLVKASAQAEERGEWCSERLETGSLPSVLRMKRVESAPK